MYFCFKFYICFVPSAYFVLRLSLTGASFFFLTQSNQHRQKKTKIMELKWNTIIYLRFLSASEVDYKTEHNLFLCV